MSRFYWFSMIVLRRMLRWIFRRRVEGTEHIPPGGALLVSNHISFYDPEFICAVMVGRDVCWLGKKELFDIPVLGPVLTWLRTIPISQQGADFKAMREALRRMARGNIIGIFPEGGRTAPGEVRPVQHGVAVLAHKAQVPVLPVGISGTRPLFTWCGWVPIPNQVVIRFGPTIAPPPTGRLTDADREEFTQRIMAAVRGLARADEVGRGV
ncbi:MAG: 1-acyl-sn-glycerol-3-phosphate acyltransferase [Armatimonadetes bacterium]|nr:1-acyl-sn-glycerol-3-phosphate acyltransferase [Armatimonadota bacterium]